MGRKAKTERGKRGGMVALAMVVAIAGGMVGAGGAWADTDPPYLPPTPDFVGKEDPGGGGSTGTPSEGAAGAEQNSGVDGGDIPIDSDPELDGEDPETQEGEETPSGGGREDGTKPCVETAILGTGGQYCTGQDGGIVGLIMKVVDILSVGVGILGVIGVTVVGLQYMTAGGDEGKVRMAKRRMLEIVIGLAVYMAFYAILKWLLPGFPNQGASEV